MKRVLDRLRSMPLDELAWRARVFARSETQRAVARMRSPRWDRRQLRRALAHRVIDAGLRRAIGAGDWLTVHDALAGHLESRPSSFLLDPSSADSLVAEVRARWPGAASDAAARADRVLAGRYDILGYQNLVVAPPGRAVDWHYDPVHDRRAPAAFWADVPYLDPALGDHKIIWEINRHQHWLTLGRALWLTGDPRHRVAIVERLESWLAANPPLVGINWASMLEIGLRALSWTWALHFLLSTNGRDRSSSSAAPDRSREIPWLVDLFMGIDRQLAHVEQHLSYYFSPNTHLTGEALALYAVGLAIPELAASDRWVERGRGILLQEIDRQIHADGGHAEASMHYHRYTLDMYVHALLAARRAQDTAAIPRFTDAVTRLAAFARAAADDRGMLPLIGDDDGGMLWPFMGRACRDVRDSLALAAIVLVRPDLAPWGVPEEAFWVGGRLAVEHAGFIDANRDRAAAAPSRTFRDSGYVVARDPSGGHAIFDVGAHGYLNAGHAHADALAITLGIANRPFLVDPGTSTYVMDHRLRDRMRDSASHNTVIVDERSQSIPGDPFRWQTRSDARLHAWRHNPSFDWAEASHDGYAPLRHRRTLLRTSSGWLVADEILGGGVHTANAHWHFDPAWDVTADAHGRLHATSVDGDSVWLLCDADAVRIQRGDEPSGLGWYAPVYGTLIPTYSAQMTRQAVAPFALVTWIGLAENGRSPSLEHLTATPAAAGDAIAARVIAGERVSAFLLRPDGPASRSTPRSVEVVDYRTDARVLHCAANAKGLRALDLIDASYATHRDGRLTVTADSPIADLHVAIEGAALDLRASEPPPQLRLLGDVLAAARTIRLNGREWPMTAVETSDTAVVIEGGLWPTGVPLAIGRVADRPMSDSQETL
ncbi:MAG: hypothetical protein AUH43_07235 [Acidobacteria bacterium 13_1_40CM_65_14]|nr:MAG: hypothetical protein AUH43_07235 [Acidobacteria bacterium 13_1_40CM_65_14]OLC80135.1 MAG: hypothetical protein AUH72_12680 [Acidobacteria bacterium 13_1_40CM_4_65_8]OLE82567.1 MAG: hypothetical protein AUF76_08980 [Acidobacteria bacterium 13_1_20CM_2_65_9]